MSETAHLLNGSDFSTEQKEYLAGFASGAGVGLRLRGLPSFAETLAAQGGGAPVSGPDALALEAARRTVSEGKKLCPEEEAKRAKHPLDRWDDLAAHASEGKFPKGTDVLMWKFHGLFYVAPAQDAFMCRLRFHGGLMTSGQMRSVADLAERFGGGYADCTTRSNLQIREIKAADAADFLESLQEAGLVARGSGADNIRNVTGSPTAGIDPLEIYDTRLLSRRMHLYILNNREMYGLPRKFNIAFDGGGRVSALSETNDIGFNAVRALDGVYFRVAFGGITGHKDFARETELLLKPEECVPFAAAAVRVFIKHGDRTDRKKARLKYLLDAWGHEKFIAETLKEWGHEPLRLAAGQEEPRPEPARDGHIGWHPQKQAGLHYVGVVLPVGRMTFHQMHGLAAIADVYGSGSIRLTVWQNLLIADIPEDCKATVEKALDDLNLGWSATGVRAGLVACTGSAGCKYANADTKKHALRIADHLESVIQLDQPVNVHLTGCPHSCAQHYIGDIGMLGTKVEAGEDMVDGFHLYVGGGYGSQQEIGREVLRAVDANDAPGVLEKLFKSFLSTRRDINESFYDWSKRHSTEELQAFCGR